MARSKDDIKYGTAQARLSEDDAVRVNYKHGTPLEGGKIAESDRIDVFSSAGRISDAKNSDQQTHGDNNDKVDRGGSDAAAARK